MAKKIVKIAVLFMILFYAAANSFKDIGEGTGLGLYIVYNMTKDYKGTIETQSRPMPRDDLQNMLAGSGMAIKRRLLYG